MTMLTEAQMLATFPKAAVVQATRHGLVLAPDIDHDAWRAIVAEIVRFLRTAAAAKHTTTAWFGDVLANAPVSARGWITECANAAGLDAGSLRNAKMVCGRIPVSCRHDALTWTHHCEVGMMFAEPTEIERWLSLAEAEQLSTGELRRRIRSHFATVAGTQQLAEGDAEVFAIMRELRATARFLDQRRSDWRGWSPSTSRLALDELKPLADFMDELRARAIRAPRPADLTDN